MVNVRRHNPSPTPHDDGITPRGARFNVLLTEDHARRGTHWSDQLPRLLGPHGVEAFVAGTGREAVDVTESVTIHAAVIDLSTPRDEDSRPAGSNAADALWLLDVLRRRPTRPPVVVVNSRLVTQRDTHRLLNDALRMGAFSVINRPAELETLIHAIARVIDRLYEGAWPSPHTQTPFPPTLDRSSP